MKSAAAVVFVLVVTSVFFIDFCNLVYRCGCTHLWAGADAKCNIHDHRIGAKQCPWCSVGVLGYGAVYSAITIPQVLLCFYPRRWPLDRRFLVSLVAFPVVGGTIAVVMGVVMGYWT